MRYFNSDGGEAEMCGNGARCFARFLDKIAGPTPGDLRFETQAGINSGPDRRRTRQAFDKPTARSDITPDAGDRRSEALDSFH